MFNNPNEFLSFFRQAAPYIHAHREKTFVIHFDCDFSDPKLEKTLHDCALLQSLGVKLVLVYGTKKEINQNLEKQGIKAEFYKGRRITTKQILPEILNCAGALRLKIEAALSMSLANSPMQDASIKVASGNFLTAQPMGIIDGIDFGLSGKIRRINIAAINSHLEQGEIVLISPIGFAPNGEIFNLNAEEVASEIAISLNAHKLIYMVAGVSELIENNSLRQLQPKLAEDLLTEVEVLYPYLISASNACEKGVRRVHLVDKKNEGALLQELFTRDGLGIMITADIYDDLRPATVDDIGHLMALIKPLEEAGILIPRSREKLEQEIEHFYLLIRDGSIIACAALYPYEKEKTAELACLAVAPEYRQHKRAEFLVSELLDLAKKQGLESVFLLTTQTAQWFEERGFVRISVQDLPEKKKNNYNYQRNSRIYRKMLV